MGESGLELIVPASGAVASFLLYQRIGYQYAFLAAMIGVAFLPHYWTRSHTAQHLIIAGAYTASLVAVIRARRTHRFDFPDDEYSVTEALLWLGIYTAMNLQLSSVEPLQKWWFATATSGEFPDAFYWATYLLIWFLPVGMIWRAVSRKDQVVARVGVIAAILTLITNKPYLGLPQHSWDPMLLGVLLTGTAVLVKHWLSQGEGGIRRGFTARRFSGEDKWIRNVLSVPAGVLANSSIADQVQSADAPFSGGDSGGGGASSAY